MLSTAYAAGATDKSVYVRGFTASTGLPYTAGAFNTSGIAARYRRAGANAEVTITLATQTVNGAHSDGGFVHVSGGVYRLDLPDAALASSSDYVDVWVYGITDVVFTTAHIDIVGSDPRATSVSVDAASVRTAVGLASANLDTQLSGIQSDTNDIQSRLPAALVAGRIDASVGAMAANTLTASALATDAVTEIQSGLATASALTTVAGYIDTEVAAVQAVTDKLDTALELDGATYRFTTNALELAPTGGSAPTAAAIRAEIDANSTQLAAIRADTEDLQAQVGVAGAGLTALGDTRLANLNAAVSSRATPAQVATELATYDAPTKAELDAAVAPLATQASVNDLPTNAELATALAGADDAVLAAIAALNNLSAAQVGDAVLDEVVEGTTTMRQMLRLVTAVCVGKASGLGTGTVTFRDLADSKPRITATVDADGNRLAVTLDAA